MFYFTVGEKEMEHSGPNSELITIIIIYYIIL